MVEHLQLELRARNIQHALLPHLSLPLRRLLVLDLNCLFQALLVRGLPSLKLHLHRLIFELLSNSSALLADDGLECWHVVKAALRLLVL